MTLLEAARQALPGIAWEQVSSNGVEYVYGKGSKGSYGAFDLADIAKFTAELTAERDALDDDLGETPRAVLTDELTALRERMRWRDVRVELPDEYEDVLAVLVQNYPKGRFAVEAHMIRDIDGLPCWRRNGQMIPDPVLWQPMPAAPEVQNG
jgi:hypothetical protein